jgi:hypothetical protein
MYEEKWDQIFEKIKSEEIPFGSQTLKLFYHDKRIVKYEITKSEATVIKEGDKLFLGE